MQQLVSVVIPMFNEEENAPDTLARVGAALSEAGYEYELLPVDDGSTDRTAEVLASQAGADPRIRPITYHRNRGRGYAMRRGFAAARGDFIVCLDADLSYTPDHAVRMLAVLRDDPDADFVIASPYMPGGEVEGVDGFRLFVSRLGNAVLRRALPLPVYTSTGIVRAYRAEVLRSLLLESDGKEIHLEILSKAVALGFRPVEMPATLRSRKRGKSKFRFKATAASHLLFAALEKPAILFAAFGLICLITAVVIAAGLLATFFSGTLNPERPLMTVMVVLLVGGATALGFTVVSMLILQMRRDILRLQRVVLGLGRDEQA
jgi:dolichol-phosphate mannosyltransferase